jgi:hypothetical protein
MDKKKERTFFIDDTIKILEEVDWFHGTCVGLTCELGTSVLTLNTIIKQRDTIHKSARECGPNSKKWKNAKYSKHDKMEKIMRKIFLTVQVANLPVSGIVLRQKALLVVEVLGFGAMCICR